MDYTNNKRTVYFEVTSILIKIIIKHIGISDFMFTLEKHEQ